MQIRTLALIVSSFLFAGCGHDHHPLEGGFSQQVAGDGEGMHVEFDLESNKLLVHTAPDADGHHDHVDGTYTFDAATGAVTVNALLMGGKKPGTWTGKLTGDDLELSAGTDKLSFRRGGEAHGH
ncbi:MAG: hypothetical protein H6838_20705 [Planctomycetes bacterium]|nr:hypothetical protein [Planctomycetota bacterium]MCB9887913.1 hypothetical protein [Planctomycetota bacterium]